MYALDLVCPWNSVLNTRLEIEMLLDFPVICLLSWYVCFKLVVLWSHAYDSKGWWEGIGCGIVVG